MSHYELPIDETENHHVAEFEKAHVDDKVPCIAPETARNDVLHLFARVQLDELHVRITRNSSGNACATLAIHVKTDVST